MHQYTENFDHNLDIDFNEIVRLVSTNHLHHSFSTNVDSNFVLNSSVQIKKIEQDKKYRPLYNHLNELFNPNSLRSDLCMFFSMNSGATGYLHSDDDLDGVHIIGVMGETIYFVDSKRYILKPKSKLFIKGGIKHKAMSISPRIILSFATYKD